MSEVKLGVLDGSRILQESGRPNECAKRLLTLAMVWAGVPTSLAEADVKIPDEILVP